MTRKPSLPHQSGEGLHHLDVGPGLGGMPLGQISEYTDVYNPSLLCPLLRTTSRAGLDCPPQLSASSVEDDVTGTASADMERTGLGTDLPFVGEDIWNAYELTWLDGRGRPQSAMARIRVSCSSPCMVESKSFKLYLGSLAQTKFGTRAELQHTLNGDLSLAFRAPVSVEMLTVQDTTTQVDQFPGICVDDANVDIHHYARNAELLRCDPDSRIQTQSLFSDQFRSLCPVTGQPDFASIWVQYSGPLIEPDSLFEYLVSYRTHSGFHEAAVEQIYLDLLGHCGCQQLSVYGRFLRRGGMDINPFRSTQDYQAPLWRLPRQ